MKTFEELGVSSEILQAITEMGFVSPMPVQEEVIPYLLGEGNDVIALAQTGTGKTAAFGIPLLQKIDVENEETQALILSPTRELCLQIADDLRDFSKYMKGVHVVPVYGGASIEQQIRALKHGAQIIVATPGRLIDLMHRGKAQIEHIKSVVLDEADEMLNMGFSDSINEIFEHVPAERNTLLFSATMSKEIEKIALNYLHDHKEIVVGSRNEGAENVNHVYYMVHARDKYLALKRIVDFYPRIFAIIFCRTKIETQEIADKLIKDGYNAESLHGDLSQAQRDLTMQKFRQHLTQLLVATDVAARGLDVDDLTHVINYGLPDDIENYTHRSGRTGRAGKKGTSISIVHSREKHKIRNIEKVIGKEFVEGEMPSAQEICKKQLYKVMDQIVKTDVLEEQIDPFMGDISRFFEFIDKEDIIKKIVSIEFGKFLSYYANAPEIEKPSSRRKDEGGRTKAEGGRSKERSRGRGSRKAEAGFRRLFINLGKKDGFFPGELMQFLNKNVKGHVEVGHIDLQNTISFFDVAEEDADRVTKYLTGAKYKGREVRCNDGGATPNPSMRRGTKEEGGRSKTASNVQGPLQSKAAKPSARATKSADARSKDASFDRFEKKKKVESKRGKRGAARMESGRKDDWRQFFQGGPIELVGEEPDFSEEGWARRKPKKRK
ncbi:MAG: DEAD/DEAH box helicase [Prevotella sp.]|nr:DEAD/DEAH box helicase [Prevotella sp.]MBR6884449.1 DEAD/DEAH box helicase [Prevotella sp.]